MTRDAEVLAYVRRFAESQSDRHTGFRHIVRLVEQERTALSEPYFDGEGNEGTTDEVFS